jgi:hypothetical protein
MIDPRIEKIREVVERAIKRCDARIGSHPVMPHWDGKDFKEIKSILDDTGEECDCREKCACGDMVNPMCPTHNHGYGIYTDCPKHHPKVEENTIAQKTIVISSQSAYELSSGRWAKVEKYLYGYVYDLGGKTESNIHVQLENGNTLTISADQKILGEDKQNRLYRNQLLRVSAKKNLKTGAIKDEHLIEFIQYDPKFNKVEFEKMVQKGRAAWKDIDNPTDWVEESRGNK